MLAMNLQSLHQFFHQFSKLALRKQVKWRRLLPAVLIGCLISLWLPAQPAQAAGCTLTAIVWEGYTDSSFAKKFEQDTGCKVKATYAGSSDEMFAKFRAGGGRTYDLISASGDITERLYKAGLVQPIDTSKLKNYDAVFSSFQGGKWNTFDGKPYGVTFAWGPNVLVYDTKAVKPAPTSWDVLADPAYAGKIALPDNPMTIADVALWLGKPDPYDLTEADLAEVKQKLLELRPNIRKFWTTAGELANLFQSGEIELAHAWPLTYTQLSEAGFPIGSVSPKGKLTGWTPKTLATRKPPTSGSTTSSAARDKKASWMSRAIREPPPSEPKPSVQSGPTSYLWMTCRCIRKSICGKASKTMTSGCSFGMKSAVKFAANDYSATC
jgi:spermidine/putrescine-binding protein